MTPKKALVVDDSRSARYSLRKNLERLHISVDCVESGETALSYLEAADEALPDIIFMDNLMPGMNGFSTSAAIHKQQRWQHIPIVMCTATQTTADFSDSQNAGTIGLLPKPATLGQIQALLADLANTSLSRPISAQRPYRRPIESRHPESRHSEHLSPEDDHSTTLQSAATPQSKTAQSTTHDTSSQTVTSTHATFNPTAPHSSTSQKSRSSLIQGQALSQVGNGTRTETRGEPIFQTHSRTAAEASLESLIDRVQAQLKGIEPRLMSLESAKQTLDRAIQQRLNDMHDQLVQYIRSLIQETLDSEDHASPNDSLREQLEQHLVSMTQDIFDERLKVQIDALSENLHDELKAQTRYMEHRLLGEAVNTEQIIEQATDAARLAVESQLNDVQSRTENVINLDEDSPLRQHILEAAENIAAEQAEKSVSDNLSRLQHQLAQSTQAQLQAALKKQNLISTTGLIIALIALGVSVMI